MSQGLHLEVGNVDTLHSYLDTSLGVGKTSMNCNSSL